MFSLFERVALSAGLHLNLGVGKTEHLVVCGDRSQIVRTLDGKEVTKTSNYKYLGVHLASFDVEFKERRKKAWVAVTSFNNIWKSSVGVATKRALTMAIIEPILSYGLGAWSFTKQILSKLRATFSAILRFTLNAKVVNDAFGVPSWSMHTEELHGSLRLFPSNVVFRQLSSWGHWIRMHLQGKTIPCCSILLRECKAKRKSGGQSQTLLGQLLARMQVDTPFDLAQLAMTREKWKTRVSAAAQAVEDQRLANKNASKSSTNE